jgi:hypothetical protein
MSKQIQHKITVKDYIKACKKGNRDADLAGKTGFVAKHKIHKGEKEYIRVKKNWLEDVE